MLVDAAQLAEICELVWSGDVADRRKQRVLRHRPQQYVRAEARRPRRRLFEQRGDRVLLVANDKAAVLLADDPAAALEVKEREAVVLGMHLGVVAPRDQV